MPALIIRQPAVTGGRSPAQAGCGVSHASLNTCFTVSSMPQRAAGDVRFQPLGHALVGVLIFLPGAHIGILVERPCSICSRARLPQTPDKQKRFAGCRQHHHEQRSLFTSGSREK